MTNLEYMINKVNKGLECHKDLTYGNCKVCPYYNEDECYLHIQKDAQELLKMMQMQSENDEKEILRSNYAAQMETLGYEPDGNPNIRCLWIHEEPAKSNRFHCSGCGKTAYYPQANNARKGGLRIPYEYCPFCGRHMITIWEGLK